MPKWVKKTEETQVTSEGKPFLTKIEWTDDENKKDLALYINHLNGIIRFDYGNPTLIENPFSEDEILKLHQMKDHPTYVPGIMNNFSFYWQKDDPKEYMQEFIDLIIKYDSSILEIRNEIYIQTGVGKPEAEIADEISVLVEQGKFNEAIEHAKKAQTDGYFEAIWALAERLHADKLVDNSTLIDLYKSIAKENTTYAEQANDRLVILYAPESLESNKEDFYSRIEKQLDAAIKTKNQDLIDQLFNQLCGYTGVSPKIKNVQGEFNTLIALAKTIRDLADSLHVQSNKDLQTEATRLKKENKELKKVIADLEKENSELKSEKTPPYKPGIF